MTVQSKPHTMSMKKAHKINTKSYSSAIDGIRFVNGQIIIKTASGKIDVWNLESHRVGSSIVYHTWREHRELIRPYFQCLLSILLKNPISEPRTRFDVDIEGKIAIAGNAFGEVLIFDLHTGTTVNHLLPKRGKSPILSCALSHDCK